MIDWEAAFANDRYADLAIAANFFVAPGDEVAYLAAYFGAPPTAYQRARFVLARFANHLSYVALLSLTAARAGVTAQSTPDGRAFHDGLIAGTIELASAERRAQAAVRQHPSRRRAYPSPRPNRGNRCRP